MITLAESYGNPSTMVMFRPCKRFAGDNYPACDNFMPVSRREERKETWVLHSENVSHNLVDYNLIRSQNREGFDF